MKCSNCGNEHALHLYITAKEESCERCRRQPKLADYRDAGGNKVSFPMGGIPWNYATGRAFSTKSEFCDYLRSKNIVQVGTDMG